jgi:hypothetical protein
MNLLTAERIAARYFVTSKKQFLHHGDCYIFRLKKAFCNCGLLLDLERLDLAFANILYAKYDDDVYLQERGKPRSKATKSDLKKQEEIKKILEDVFGKVDGRLSFEEIKLLHDEYKRTLKSIFPRKTDCPGVYARLGEWLKKEISKPEN